MSRAKVSSQGVTPPEWSAKLCDYADKIADELKRENWQLSFLLCDDKKIRELNKQYRGIDEATDVLSFALGEDGQEDHQGFFYPGDIVISLDTLHENSNLFKIDEDEELRRLVIHGILHLDGMDHETNNEDEPMLILQENLLKKYDNVSIM